MFAPAACPTCNVLVDGQPEATLAHLIQCEDLGSECSLHRDTLTGRSWLHFFSRPGPDTIAVLKSRGWRWSGFRKAWHNPRKGIKPPEGIRYEIGAPVDYAAERADRLEDRAAKANATSNAAAAKAHAIGSAIPFGQPILVGHHSEKRHRRDAGRIDGAMRKAVDEGRKAERLESAADASRRHQAHMKAAGTIARRLDRLNADLRKMERTEWQNEAARQERIAMLRGEIAEAEAQLAEAGGKPGEGAVCKKGDLIKIKGWVVRVARVNPKTITGTIAEGGAAGMAGKWDRSHFQCVIQAA